MLAEDPLIQSQILIDHTLRGEVALDMRPHRPPIERKNAVDGRDAPVSVACVDEEPADTVVDQLRH